MMRFQDLPKLKILSFIVAIFSICLLILALLSPQTQTQKAYQKYNITKVGKKSVTFHFINSESPKFSIVFLSRMTSFDQILINGFRSNGVLELKVDWHLEQADLIENQLEFNPVSSEHCGSISKNFPKHKNNVQALVFSFPQVKDSFGKIYRINIHSVNVSEQDEVDLLLKGRSNPGLSTMHVQGRIITRMPEFIISQTEKNNLGLPLPLIGAGKLKFCISLLRNKLSIPILFLCMLLCLITFRGQGRFVSTTRDDKTLLYSNRNYILVIIICVMIGFIVRCYHLDTYRLSIDEEFSAYIAGLPFFDAVTSLLQDKHPPLYYMLLKVWTALYGSSIISLRFPSVLFSTFSIIVLAIVSAIIDDRKTGFLAMVFLTILPIHIDHAQIARMYSLLGFFSLLSILLFLLVWSNQDRKLILGLVMTNICLLLTHYFGLFIVFAELLIILIAAPGNKKRFFWICIFFVQGLVLSSWLIPNLMNVKGEVSHLSGLTLQAINYLFWLGSPLHGSIEVDHFSVVYGLFLFVSFFAGLCVPSDRKSLWWFPLVLVFVVICMITMVCQVVPIFRVRNMFIIIPFLPLIWSRGIFFLYNKMPRMQIIIVFLFVMMNLSCYYNYLIKGYCGQDKDMFRKTPLMKVMLDFNSDSECNVPPSPKTKHFR